MENAQAPHRMASRHEWLTERLDLLDAEKELTRLSDEVALRRQALPWVRVEKSYQFDTQEGPASLKDLFHGRSQLLVYHLMFGPDYTAPCPSCSMIADGFNGFWEHLAHHDVMLFAVSRAPLAKLQECKTRMRWTFPWASSFGSDFNFDYGVGFDQRQQSEGYEYNFTQHEPIAPTATGAPGGFAAMCGVSVPTYLREMPGMSAFVADGADIYHCYSTYARGLDALWGAYQWLDRAPLGRNESGGAWWKRRDEYAAL